MIIEAAQFNDRLKSLVSEDFNPECIFIAFTRFPHNLGLAWRQLLYATVNFILSQPVDAWEAILVPLKDAFFGFSSQETRNELASILIDVIWVVDLGCDGVPSAASTDTITELSPERQLLAKLLNYILQLGLASPTMAKERLESDLLEAAKAIQSATLFNKKQIRINTAMHYKQQKFNLMREETEGYAKLVCLLIDARPGDDPLWIYQQAIAFIGYFDLDPIRVLDVIFDCFAFACHEKGPLFIALLKKFDFPMTTVSSILGFKLKFLSTLKGEPVLDGMMSMTALLLKHGILDLEHIFAHLHPSNEACEEMAKRRKADILAASKKVGVVSLASKPAADPKEPSGATKASDIPSSSLGYQDIPLALRSFDVEENQKVILIAKLLSIRETELARKVMSQIPHAFALSTAVFKEICGLIDELIEPAYAIVRVKGEFTDQSINILKLLNDWFENCGFGLYTDPLLITKICRLSAHLVASNNDESLRTQVLNLILNYLLPAISLNTANPALVNEIWALLQLFPYQTRFTLYYQWRNSVYGTCAELKYCRAVSINDIRRVMRRLAKENVKQFGRLIGKITHANPVIVFPIILDQLQSYDNLIQPVIDSFKYLTPLDTLIEALSNPEKDRLKEDGTNLSSWLQNLAMFSGLFFKKYTALDLTPLISYIYYQLNDDNTLDLVVLSELLQKMAGLESAENFTDQELEAQAGGPILKTEVASLQNRNVALKGHRKPSQKLLASLVQSELAVPLWIMLGKLAFSAVYKTDISHLKLLGLLTDQCHDVLIQYSEFFAQHAFENGLKIEALPNVHELKEMGVELDYAFYMRRVWEKNFIGKSNLELLIAELGKGISSSVLLPTCPNLCLTSTVLECFWKLELQDLWVPSAIYESEINRFKGIAASTEAPLLIAEADKAKWQKDKERAGKVIGSLEAEMELRKGVVKLVNNWLTENRNLFFSADGNRTDIIAQLLHFCVMPRALFSPSDAIYAAKFMHSLHMLGCPNFSSLSCYDRIINGLASYLVILTEKEAHCYGRFLNEVLALLARWHGNKEFYEKEAIGEGRPGFLQKWGRKNNHCSSSTGNVGHDNEEDEEKAGEDGMRMDTESPVPSNDMDIDGVTVEKNQAPVNNPLMYEDFRHVMYKWHLKLYRAFLAALETGDYMPIRNAIIILSRTTNFFPALRKIGGSLEKAVGKIMKEEEGKREDLRLLATRLSAMLTGQKGRWVAESVFHRVGLSTADADNVGGYGGGVEASPKRSSTEAVGSSAGGDELETKVKRMKLEGDGDADASHSQTPPPPPSTSNSKEEAERELRRKLEERKRAAASDSTKGSKEKDKEKEKEVPSSSSASRQQSSKEQTSTKISKESSSRVESSRRSGGTSSSQPTTYENRRTPSDREQWRHDRYRDQDNSSRRTSSRR